MSIKFPLIKAILHQLLIIIIILDFTGLAFAAPGDLDPTFDTDGKVTTAVGSSIDEIRAMVVQPDGKIVVAGAAVMGANFDFAVARYNTNGSLDTTFDTDGKVTTAFSTGSDSASAVALQPDGKIIAAGSARIDNEEDFALVRYNTDGSLDTTFDTDGKLTTGFGSGIDRAKAVAVQPDGKIVVAGYAVTVSFFDFALVRYNADGSLDTTFDTDGKVTTAFDTNNDEAYALALQPDGKIVAVGSSFLIGAGYHFTLARYNTNGSLDTTFDTDGKVTTIMSNYDHGNAIALQPDGKIVIAGEIQLGTTDTNFGLVRYNTNGSLDTTFDSDGKVNTAFGTLDDEAYAVAVQSNGKIVAAGFTHTQIGGFFDLALARYNADGSLDTSFSTDGKVTTDFQSNHDRANAIALQSDGKIIAAGFSRIGTTDDFSLARYLGDPVANRNIPFDFDGDGKADISVFRPLNGTWYLNQSTNGFTAVQFGLSTDKLVPADYDGDGKTDIAVFRDGNWYILQSGNNELRGVQFGISGDVPVPRDYDGDGRDDIAVFRPSTGTWYLLQSLGGFVSLQFGQSGDIPVADDYDGDGKCDVAVYRGGTWYFLQSRDGFSAIQFGISNDVPVASDYDGDGRADYAVFRSGVWYIQRSRDGFTSTQFGLADDRPAPADYDGDGKADIAVFRQGNWYIQRSASGFEATQFGTAGDLAVPSAYVP